MSSSWGQVLFHGSRLLQLRIYNSYGRLYCNPTDCCSVVLKKKIFKHVFYICLCLFSTLPGAPLLVLGSWLQQFRISTNLGCLNNNHTIFSILVLEKNFLKHFPNIFHVKLFTPSGAPVLVPGSRLLHFRICNILRSLQVI